MDDRELRHSLKIEVDVLESWIEQGWLIPAGQRDQPEFTEVDLARGRLILDLVQSMGVNEAGVDVAISLIDQLHGLRLTLRGLIEAIDRQDATLRHRLSRTVIDIDTD